MGDGLNHLQTPEVRWEVARQVGGPYHLQRQRRWPGPTEDRQEQLIYFLLLLLNSFIFFFSRAVYSAVERQKQFLRPVSKKWRSENDLKQ